ncbi:hypothetical protein [Vibrio ichthyoenteri]|nr:hypothetical protein [Vibrio ichthyoenteri]
MKQFTVIQTVCAFIDPMGKLNGFSTMASICCDRKSKHAKQ